MMRPGENRGLRVFQQCVDETVPVLVTTEFRREAIVILSPCELDGEIIEITGSELDRLAWSRFVIADLTRCEELGRSGRSLLTQLHAWLPVGAELSVVAVTLGVLEALRASALGRSLPCYATLEDALTAARLLRAEFLGFRRVDPARPGLRTVDCEECYSADWL